MLKTKKAAYSFILPGSVPAKKNSRTPFIRNGRIMNFPNKRYVAWHKESFYALKALGLPCKELERAVLIVTFYQKDRRSRDLSNQFESIADLLVDYKFLKDDNCFILGEGTFRMGGIDRECPRAEIEVYC
jgi:hypothetical protein